MKFPPPWFRNYKRRLLPVSQTIHRQVLHGSTTTFCWICYAKSKRLCEWAYLAIFSRHDGHPSSFGPRHPRREYHARILAHGRVRRSHDRIRISQGTVHFLSPASAKFALINFTNIPIRFFQGHDCNHSRRSRNQWKIPCLARHWKLWWQVMITPYDIKSIWNCIRASI